MPAGSRSKSQLYQLKHELLHIALEEETKVVLFKQICGAASHAAELAWNESCPLLIFPCLFEELVQNAREQVQCEQVWQIDELLQPPTVAENSDANGDQNPGHCLCRCKLNAGRLHPIYSPVRPKAHNQR
jgi:hypothetical protein